MEDLDFLFTHQNSKQKHATGIFVSLFQMFSAQAAAGEVNRAAKDRLEAWTETRKSRFFLGKVS